MGFDQAWIRIFQSCGNFQSWVMSLRHGYRNLLVDLTTPGCLAHLLKGHTVWWPGWDTFMAAAVTAANMIKRRRCIAAWHVYIHRHAAYILLALAYGSFALQLPKMAFSNQVWHMIIDRIKICKATIAILQGEFACTRHLVKGLSTHLTHAFFLCVKCNDRNDRMFF